MYELSKPQLKWLRKESHQHKPIFQMGKNGITDAFYQQVDEALEKRELVKISLLQNTSEELEETAQRLSQALEANIVQTIGSTIVLYRRSNNKKNRKISEEVRHAR